MGPKRYSHKAPASEPAAKRSRSEAGGSADSGAALVGNSGPSTALQALPVAPAVAAADAAPPGFNDQYFALMRSCVARAREYFNSATLDAEACLEVKDGGLGSPYCADDAGVALASRGAYECHMSAFKINLVSVTLPKVPIRMRGIDELASVHFPGATPPRSFPTTVRLVVPSATELPRVFDKLDGDEMLAACFVAFNKASENVGDQPAIMGQWATFLRSIPVCIEVVTSADAVYLRKRQLKEDVSTLFMEISLTTLQEVYDIVAYREQLQAVRGEVSNGEVAKCYLAGVRFSRKVDKSEEMSENKIKCALQIHRSLLVLDDVASRLAAGFEAEGPRYHFAGIEKLRLLGSFVRAERDLAIWILDMIAGLVKRNHIGPELPYRELNRNQKTKEPGLIEQVLYVKAVVGFVLKWLADTTDSLGPYKAAHLARMVKYFGHYHEFDAVYSCDEGDTVDLSWQSDFPQSLRLCCDMLKDLLDFQYRATLRHHLRQKSEVADFLSEGTLVSEAWSAVKQQRASELKADTTAKCADAAEADVEVTHSPINRILALKKSNSGDKNQSAVLRFESFRLEWTSVGRTLIAKTVKLVLKPRTVIACRDLLKLSVAAQVPDGIMAVVGIGKEMGEHMVRPLVQKYIPEEEQWECMLKGMVLARAEITKKAQVDEEGRPLVLDPRVVYILGQTDNLKKNKIFGRAVDVQKNIHVLYTESSVEERQTRVRGTATLSQCERYMILHSPNTQVASERRQRLFYPGTTSGDCIAGVVYTPPVAPKCVQISSAEAKKVHGNWRSGTVAAGGDEEPEVDTAPFKHTLPRPLSAELLHVVRPSSIVDLSPADGERAILSIGSGTAYIGLCTSESHKSYLEQLLVTKVLREFGSNLSPLYRGAFCDDVTPLLDSQDARVLEKLEPYQVTDEEAARDFPDQVSFEPTKKKKPGVPKPGPGVPKPAPAPKPPAPAPKPKPGPAVPKPAPAPKPKPRKPKADAKSSSSSSDSSSDEQGEGDGLGLADLGK